MNHIWETRIEPKKRRNIMKKVLLTFLVTALGLVFTICDSDPAYSQEGDIEFILEDIVVTAQKREQELQDVPIPITYVGAEQLERTKVYTLQDLERTAPALEFGDTDTSPGGGARIRGIGTVTFDNQIEPSVGVTMDGVPMGTINIGNMFDVERVEVLRGPQGTLFGDSSSAGIINIITVSPKIGVFEAKLGFDATLDGTLGSKFGRQELRAMLNIPLSENSALRVTGNGNFMQGLYKNHAQGMDDPEEKNTDLRLKYLYLPTDDLSLNLTFDYAKREKGYYIFTFTEIPEEAADPAEYWVTDMYNYLRDVCGITVRDPGQAICTYKDDPDGLEQEWWGLSAQVDWSMANHDFVSISSYKRFEDIENKRIFGIDWIPGLLVREWSNRERHFDTYTQELRVHAPAESKLDYLAGVYYMYYKITPDNPGTILTQPPVAPHLSFLAENAVPEDREGMTSTHTRRAIFADANYPVTDAFKVFGGIRFSQYDIDMHLEWPDGLVTDSTYEKDFTTFRAGLQFDVNEDFMLYTTYSRSVKAPVVMSPPVENPLLGWSVLKGEVPTAIEVGAKLETLDHRVAVDLNLFYSTVEDYQASISDLDEYGVMYTTRTNIPEVETKGVELDIFGQPLPGLALNMGAIYNIIEYPSTWHQSGRLVGQQMQNTPKFKVSFSGEYTKSLPTKEELLGFFGLDFTYKSEILMTAVAFGDVPDVMYPAHWMFGARAGIRKSDGKWTISLFGRNLFNEMFPSNKIFDFGMTAILPKERSFRQVGVNLEYAFF
jgi:iron complex outermembrane receptor protein